ncbi:MAG: anti-sigma factor [Bacteroidota bacterium]
MKKNEVIEQGLIEQYVLGELSDPQRGELESLLNQDHDLSEYLEQVEQGLEKLAMENAIAPPAIVKTNLLSEVSKSISEEEKIIQLPQNGKSFNWPAAIAASISVILMVSTFLFYNNWKESQIEVLSLQNDLNRAQLNLLQANVNAQKIDKWYQAVNDPNANKLLLKGNQLSPQSVAVTYINHDEQSVFVNAKGLPKLADDQTYQMWADVEGVMVNMGVIPSGTDMIALKYIDHAESVNLTIEPEGGSDHPTVEKLIANIYL